MEHLKYKLQSSRNIGILSIIIFVAVAASMMFSTYYINISIKQEEYAQTMRTEYRTQGESLKDASDYLTEEVRYFAVTGQIRHFYNYWNEIYSTRRREQAIENFESSNPPKEEQEFLEEAKKYSDLLVETETCSMKLVLSALDIDSTEYWEQEELKQYIEDVMAYEWPSEISELSSEEQRNKAIELLYDENYEDYKVQIMTPIEQFQNKMNQRLDAEVERRKENTKMATGIQIFLAMISLLAIGFLMNLMNHLYIRPLKQYTEEIKKTQSWSGERDADMEHIYILDAKIIPCGANELVSFAEAFNRMIEMFFHELCHRRNAEESMRRAKNEAQLANKAKSTFLAQMTHELRTPLNAINGYTYMLEQTGVNSRQKNYMRNIHYSSAGLLDMINQILDFSKIESGRLEFEQIDFDFREMIREVKGIFEHQAEKKRLYLNIDIDERIPPVLVGDSLRVRQILINLIGNAIKFTEKGGVTVTVLLEEQKEYDCRLRMDIVDTGIGVKEEVKKKIFQPFVQSDGSITRRYGGTGLGLPICSQIVAMCGDGTHRLHLKSKIDVGSDFYFRMDFSISKLREIKSEETLSKIPNCRGKKILITDDNEVNIQVESEILYLCNVEVYTAESGKKALEILQKEKHIDLIFMDIRMPDMDGYETCTRVRELSGYEQTPIIALTADATVQVKKKVKSVGMQGCLLKPIRQEKLFQILSEYLNGEEVLEQIEERMSSEKLFDEDRCLHQFSQRRETMLSVIESFLELHKEELSKMDSCMQVMDYKKAEKLVHNLKGVTGNLCCFPLSESCRIFQEQLNRNQTQEYQNFCKLWNDTWEVLEEVILKQKKPEENKKKFSQEEISKLLEDIAEFCKYYDTEAVLLVEENEGILKEIMGNDQMKELKKYSLRYEFDKMLDNIDKARKERMENVSSDACRR